MGVARDAQAHAHGQGEDDGYAQRVLRYAARVVPVAQGHGGGYRRDDGDGERGDEARGQVVERLRLAVDAVEHLGLLIAEARRVLEPAHAEAGVYEVYEREHARAEGNRYRDAQERPEHVGAGLGNVRALPAGAVEAALAEEHIAQRGQRADRDAEDGARRGRGQAVPRADEIPREREPGGDLREHLEHLADRGGGHVLVALAVAAVGAGEADEQHRGAQSQYAQPRLGVVQRVRERVGEEGHYERAHDAYDKEGPPGHGEYPPHLVGPVHRVRLRDEPRERDRQPRRGQREEDAVDVVGHEEVRVALVAEDVAEGYLVDGAEYLHNHDAEGEYRRAVEVILLSGFAQAAFLLSVDRQLLTLH